MDDAPADPAVTCVRCKNAAEFFGQVPLVTGGRSTGAKFFFTQFALAAERNWTVDIYRCTHCGHLEMFDLSVVNANRLTTT